MSWFHRIVISVKDIKYHVVLASNLAYKKHISSEEGPSPLTEALV